MFELTVLALVLTGFIFMKLLGSSLAKQPIIVRETARVRRKR
jgi:hypothetical protein